MAILDRARDHRTFRRIRAARLEELLAEARPAPPAETADEDSSGAAPPGTAPSGTAPSGTAPDSSGPSSSAGPSTSPSSPSDTEPPTGPAPGGSDRGTGLDGGSPL